MQNNFNDTVDELKDFNLNPSEHLWKEIESNLDEKKKRRIVAWWWIFPAVILFGITFIVYDKNTTTNLKLTVNDSTSMYISKTYNQSNLTSTQSSSTNMQSNKTSMKSDLTNLQSKKTSSTNYLTSMKSKKTYTKSNSTSIESDLSNMQSNKTSKKNDFAYNKSNFTSLSVDLATEIVNEETVQNKNVDTTKHIDSSMKKENLSSFVINIAKKSVWSFVIGGGANYISRNNIFIQSNESLLYSSGLTSIPTTSTTNPSSALLSLPKTGYKFSLGVHVEKPLNKKVSIQSGLMYRYLENKLTVNNNLATNFLSTTSSLEYKNNLHLIELPINLKYCFNPRSKNKLSLLAGGNIAFALKKNWLFVNDDLYQYQESSNEINTVLFGLQTSASINFNNKFCISLIAQKNITSIQKSSSKYYLQQVDLQLNIPFKSFKK
jgi:hypothetical protein